VGSDLESSIRYLYALQSHGIKPGLSRTVALLTALRDPHRSFQVFHVAGTNGKGSTAAILASILSCQGYRVGLYTSPHLVDFTERIRVDGAPIAPESVRDLTETVRRAAETHLSEPPTFFEATTALAFAHFARSHVQYAVVEVGLGGRFDATNVVTPLVSIITTIGLDHQEYLGNTCEEIAKEKAGIIKPGTPVVTGRIEASPLSVIQSIAQDKQAPCVSLTENFAVLGETPARFAYRGSKRTYQELNCPLSGRHQLDNAACALAALEVAEERGLHLAEANVRKGLQTVCWPGRLELVSQQPDILLDGAHNPQAAEALGHFLAQRHADRSSSSGQVIFVIGMMRDKDRRGVLARLAAVPGAGRFILTRAEHPRAADPQDLVQDSAELGIPIEVAATVREACVRAGALTSVNDTICVTGSLLVVGEAKAFWERTTVSDLRG
jgi:dihydrofolate synthase/folylpolyglutamate synthase